MSNLTETATYEAGIYQLETTDPVLGGPGGIDNLQSQQLANRTAYLKQHVDALEDGTLIPPGIATEAYVQDALEEIGYKQKVRVATTSNITLSGAQTIDGVSVVATNRVLVKNQTDGTENGIYSASATAWTRAVDANESEDVTAGMIVVVAEGTLQADSIWKLTTNDPIVLGSTALVFADITAGYAPLASPAFTGNPSAPTPAIGDNDTSIATSAFVMAATDGLATVNVAGGANVTLTTAQHGLAILALTGIVTANIDLIFPNASGQWVVANNSTGAFNITAKTAAGTGVVVPQGYAVVLYGDGTNIYAASAAGQASFKTQTFTPAAGTTTLTVTGGYTVGAVMLEKNGFMQAPTTDFTATNGSTITLATASTAGDTFVAYAFSTFNVANALQKSGDTMAGPLVLAGNASTALEAVPKQQLDAAIAAIPVSKQLQGVTATVAANAMTLGLAATSLDFRSATLGSGVVNTRVVASPISLVISSGSTLGTVNGVAARIAILAIDNAGAVELAAVNLAGGVNLDETGVISTTAEGGAGAADSANIIYSATARTGVPFRVVGFIDITEAAAGTWATAPSTIQGCGGQAISSMQSLGYGQTWQNVTGSRALATTYYNTTGKPIFVNISGQSASIYAHALTVNGLALVGAQITTTGTQGGACWLVPAGASYSYAGPTTIVQWSELR